MQITGYTVEFGVVREESGIKAFGAGVLSSYGELAYMASGKAELQPFDPYAKQPKMRCAGVAAAWPKVFDCISTGCAWLAVILQ